jgi:hypothetical protein
VHVILRAVDNLKTILPHATRQLQRYLGCDGQLISTQDVASTRKKRAIGRVNRNP